MLTEFVQKDDRGWAVRAELAQDELYKSYWDDTRKLFHNAAPCSGELCTEPFNYWWLAHAADTLADGLERTGDSKYKRRLSALYEGTLERNGGEWPNEFYDDMEWMALAWLRAYGMTNEEKYKQAAIVLWEDIKTGWNGHMGGGIAWRKPQPDYKNTPANAPAAILAARLYLLLHNEDDLAWAKKIYDWQKANLVDPQTGLVWDGMNRTGDGAIDKDWKFTYCQGIYIGAGVELFRVTNERVYLDDAIRTARNVNIELSDLATCVLPTEGDGDGGLFKGVLVRYLAQLVLENPAQQETAALLKINADNLWELGQAQGKVLFGNCWAHPPGAVVPLSTQLSGAMLLEQVAMLERAGLLQTSFCISGDVRVE